MTNKLIIKCPKCGYQYLPSEIFFPESFLGSAHDVVRNAAGKIIHAAGEDPDLKETYTCDCCGSSFTVEANITMKSSLIEEDEDFY